MDSCLDRQVVALVAILFLAGCERAPVPGSQARVVPKPQVAHVAAHAPPPVASEEKTKVSVAALSFMGIQDRRWSEAKIKPASRIATDKAVMLYLRTQNRYETVAKMRANGVPAPVIFALHYRESSNSFRCHLHEGSSLLARTKFVPKGRLPAPDDPPYEWEHSAEDAIYICDRLQGPWSTVAWSLDKIEGYNGLGYRKLAVPSPYLWAGTDRYERGKYTGDGHYSATAVDQQLGTCAILLRMKEKGVPIKFAP